ncbi:gas vesicle protein GvpA/GvpJ/GvpM family [Kribbella amoyensis]|uniref:Gas vesicle protein GvpA/GvpJ/GvpM family n=1 Tax=Kribbella amoyensis TaxID=996641 RepID=A0A561BSF4_9ACTN|nr:gas vesicle protein GvpJ [Kribbella amoyensis]TWD81703.1 gas vesicle protein GvpA/GvpJ/GvpM family [Kribbella amoyensis]
MTAEPVLRDAAGPIALVDLLDRLLGNGVVVSADVLISLAGIDLVEVRLGAVIQSVRAGRGLDD